MILYYIIFENSKQLASKLHYYNFLLKYYRVLKVKTWFIKTKNLFIYLFIVNAFKLILRIIIEYFGSLNKNFFPASVTFKNFQ